MKNILLPLVVMAPLFQLAFPSSSVATDFATAQSYTVGIGPSAIVVGDFNGDGKPDLAVSSWFNPEVSILINNGDGTFKAAMNLPLGVPNVGPQPMSMAVGDFNGDGKLDLIVSSEGEPAFAVSGAVFVLLGNGDGTFQTPVQLPTGQQFPLTVAIGVFNSDGKPDLIVGDPINGVVLLLGKGDGTFQPASTVIS